jgi:hypothetical protein
MQNKNSPPLDEIRGIALKSSANDSGGIDVLLDWIKGFHWRHHETRMRVIELEHQVEILKARCDALEEKLSSES